MGPLVNALNERLGPEDQLDVVTAKPTRYGSYSKEAADEERIGGARVRRITLPKHQSGFIDQAKTFIAFAREVLRLTSDTRYDLVISTSSRLMTAALGAYIAQRDGARLCLDIRDIFVDTIGDVLPRKLAFVAVPFFDLVEKWTIRRANLVTLVSRGFSSYFERRYPQTTFRYLTNGIDREFIDRVGTFGKDHEGGQPIRLLYAGNMGAGQGLHRIVPGLAEGLGDGYEIILVGDGGTRPALEAEIAARGLSNVELRKPVGRDDLLDLYRAADVLFLHLNDYDAFKKVLPSKLFEYGATEKPILAGIGGHAAEFARSEIPNLGLFAPCDVDGALRAFRSLDTGQTDRSAFIAKYDRAAISGQLADAFLSVMPERSSLTDP